MGNANELGEYSNTCSCVKCNECGEFESECIIGETHNDCEATPKGEWEESDYCMGIEQNTRELLEANIEDALGDTSDIETFFIQGSDMGWMRRSGWTFAEEITDLIDKIGPNTEFTQTWYELPDGKLSCVQSHHDAPTGESYTITPVRRSSIKETWDVIDELGRGDREATIYGRVAELGDIVLAEGHEGWEVVPSLDYVLEGR